MSAQLHGKEANIKERTIPFINYIKFFVKGNVHGCVDEGILEESFLQFLCRESVVLNPKKNTNSNRGIPPCRADRLNLNVWWHLKLNPKLRGTNHEHDLENCFDFVKSRFRGERIMNIIRGPGLKLSIDSLMIELLLQIV